MVCGLLLLASAINYMDRQTLASAAVRVTREFQLSHEQYGILESWFGYAFALGSLVFGFLADRLSLRWLYAVVVLLWSVTGIVTGFTSTYDQLLACRAVLGFVEGGHWPCAVKATRALLAPKDRALGNGVLQSGTSIGAIITPLLMSQLMSEEPGSWRLAFQAVASVGFLWIVAWFGMVRDTDFRSAARDSGAGAGAAAPSLASLIFSRRMLVIFIVIACINTTWQILRAWLPKILQEGRGWSESSALQFNALWFAATDVGCLAAGALVTWLVARGRSLDRARILVFSGCALLCGLCAVVPRLSGGWSAPLLLLLIGAAALGLFPIYHAFTQDISGEHQGRITGIASVAAWIAPAQAQRLFGALADRTGSFDIGFTLAGFLPLLAALALVFGWRARRAPPAPAPAPSS